MGRKIFWDTGYLGERSALAELIRRARYRHVVQLVIEQGFFASAVVLGGGVLLLLIGTRVFSAAWLAPLFAVALAGGLIRARSRLRTPYQLTQELDQRLDLKDRLSTAYYFSTTGTPPRHAPRDLVESQRATAEEAARGADLHAGMPFVMPKSLYASAILGMLAAGVFGVRFGVTRSLDLSPSLVQIAFANLLGGDDAAAAKKKGSAPKPGVDRPQENALTVDPWESKALDAQGPPETALNTVDTPPVDNPNYNTESNTKANGTPSKDPLDQQSDDGENGAKSPDGSDQMAADNGEAKKDGSKPGKPQQSGDQDKAGSNSSGENSSLADKMRDALSNLMSKLKPKPGEGKQGPAQPGQQNAQQRQGKDDKGTPQPGKPQQDAMSSPDQQGDQDGQSSDKAASAQSKSGKNSDKPPSQDGKSGVGKEDGDKSAREAEQLAAMGKISEIIGKRAANMTGEVMVEVSSGKQQLKTQYSQRKAAHADAGGEISRDEVPLAYQQFVQQYFEEIRKTPAPASPAQSKSKKNPGGS